MVWCGVAGALGSAVSTMKARITGQSLVIAQVVAVDSSTGLGATQAQTNRAQARGRPSPFPASRLKLQAPIAATSLARRQPCNLTRTQTRSKTCSYPALPCLILCCFPGSIESPITTMVSSSLRARIACLPWYAPNAVRSRPAKQACPRAGRSAARTAKTCPTTSTPPPRTRDGSRRRALTRTSSSSTWLPTTAPRASRPPTTPTRATRSAQLTCLSSTGTAGDRPAGGSLTSPGPKRRRAR